MRYLKQKILEHINRYNIAISEFEKKAGVGNAVVNRILDDKVKNPSIETVLKIANALKCSLDELFDKNEYLDSFYLQDADIIKHDHGLFRSVCFYVMYFIEIHESKLKEITYERIISIIEVIFKYCIERNLRIVDAKFAMRFLKKALLNS